MAVGAPAAASSHMKVLLLDDHVFLRWGSLAEQRFDFIAAGEDDAGRQAPWPPRTNHHLQTLDYPSLRSLR